MRRLPQLVVLPVIVAAGLAASFVAPARASVTPLGQQGCPAGQVVGTRNLVRDGNFVEAAAGTIAFETELPNRGPGVYPGDTPPPGQPAGGFSIQTGNVTYEEGRIVGRIFEGDSSREVPSSNTYFYSNPNQNATEGFFFDDEEGYLWRQTVAVNPNTVYNFYAYFDNLLIPNTTGNDPVIELRVADPADSLPGIAAGPPITVTKMPDSWVPIQYAFKTGVTQTEARLEIWDVTGKYVPDPTNGSDFAMVGVNLRQCAAALGIAKAVAEPVRTSDGAYELTYTITVRNFSTGLEPVNSLQVTDALTGTFANAASFGVTAVSGSANLDVDTGFTGVSPKINLLDPGNTLDSGETGTITFTVRVVPGSGLGGRGPFLNRATVSADSGGATVRDESTPGSSPDLDGDDNPKEEEEDEDTPVSIGRIVAIPLLSR